jgi:heme oxygenase (biliverdin-IX-beta and delta-forming)
MSLDAIHNPPAATLSRRERLKSETRAEHMRLDALVTGRQFFSSVEHYGQWLQGSYAFHDCLEHALEDAGVDSLTADWPERRKTEAIKADLQDLGLAVPGGPQLHTFKLADATECLGALYVMEGASMGARVLLISAHRLGLDAHYGARHLSTAAASMQHWKTFVALLEAAPSNPSSNDRMIRAARRTFDLARECFSGGGAAA